MKPGKWNRYADRHKATHEIVVDGNPYPWRTPRRTRDGRAYKHAKLKAWQDVVALVAACQWSGPLLGGALRVGLVVMVARPKSHLLKNGELKAAAPCFCMSLRTGDTTNHLKAVEDALTGIVWKDDCQVVETMVEKHYADGDTKPGVTIRITEL